MTFSILKEDDCGLSGFVITLIYPAHGGVAHGFVLIGFTLCFQLKSSQCLFPVC